MSLAVHEFGAPEGRPVVMLHSLFFDGSMFDVLAAGLGDGVRVICPDHRGQGASPREGALGMDDLADDVAGLIATLGEPVDLVGSSMGAYVAARVAARHPELVSSLALLCASGTTEPDRARFDSLTESLGTSGGADHVSTIERTMFGSEFLSRPADDVQRARWSTRFAALRPDIAAAMTGVFGRDGMEHELAGIRMPLLLVAGELDNAKRPADMEAIRAIAPHARLEVLAGAGHTPAVESPDELGALLTDFWTNVHTSTTTEQGALR